MSHTNNSISSFFKSSSPNDSSSVDSSSTSQSDSEAASSGTDTISLIRQKVQASNSIDWSRYSIQDIQHEQAVMPNGATWGVFLKDSQNSEAHPYIEVDDNGNILDKKNFDNSSGNTDSTSDSDNDSDDDDTDNNDSDTNDDDNNAADTNNDADDDTAD